MTGLYRHAFKLLPLFLIWMFVVLGCSRLIPSKTDTNTNISVTNNSQTSTTPTNNATRPTPPQQTTQPSTKAMAWMMGSNLSLAALMHERGVKKASDDFLAKSNILSRELINSDVPPLPAMVGDRPKDAASIMGYLLKTSLPPMGQKLQSAHSAVHVNLFEIAIKSNTLLILYGPEDDIGKSIAGFIEKVAPQANLPENLWKPVTNKVNSKASYEEVKEAVFKMHSDVRAYLEANP